MKLLSQALFYNSVKALGRRVSVIININKNTMQNTFSKSLTQGAATVDDGIAVIGLGCRLPGGISTPEAFWDALSTGRDLVSEVPAERFCKERFEHPLREVKGHSVTFKAGIFGDLKSFDAAFFRMNKSEAQTLDPQQRLMLEMSVDALESAGIRASKIKGSNTAVFVGAASTDMALTAADDAAKIGAYSMTGTNLSIVSNRLSYFYDLHGESMTIDTACSSAMTALCKACEALASGSCELALAGGVNVLISPLPFVGFSQAHMLSAGGRCKVFSKDADGYVRSEGGALLVLKRLADAKKDGDHILGVIRAAALNQDGRTSGIALPNGGAQQALLQQIYQNRSLEHLIYVEAHGTGTAAGDPVECSAIGMVLGRRLQAEQHRPLYIGSVKSNAGHLETASGMAGLVKALLILQHRELPRQLWAEELNSRIDFNGLNLEVVRQNIKLADNKEPLQIGINSFGFGGSNAHVLLESAPAADTLPKAVLNADQDRHGKECLLLSAQTAGALKLQAAAFAKFFKDNPQSDTACAAASVLAGRDLYEKRLMLQASTRDALIKGLENFASDKSAAAETETAPDLNLVCADAAPEGKTAFVFSGNGAQYPGMGSLLYRHEPLFAAAFDDAASLLHQLSGFDYKALMLADPQSQDLSSPVTAQPLLFAVEYALSKVLLSYGIKPDGCIGHSVGEVAAACICGALTLKDACMLILKRSYHQAQTSTKGGMAAVKLPYAILSELLSKSCFQALSVAAVNAPASFTLSGDKELLLRLGAEIKARRGAFKLLKLNYAFHSQFMEPVEQALKADLSVLKAGEGCFEFYSTVGAERTPGSDLTADYWWHNVREPVRFMQTLECMLSDGYTRFIEIGPRSILTSYIRQCAAQSETNCAVEGLCSKTEDESRALQLSLLRLTAAGFSTDLSFCFDLSKADKSLQLPHYAFDRKICWPEPSSGSFKYFEPERVSALLGCRLPFAQSFLNELDVIKQPYFAGHEVLGEVLLPFSAYLLGGMQAAQYFASRGLVMRLLNLELFAPVNLSSGLKDFKVEVHPDHSIFFHVRAHGAKYFAPAASCRALPYDGSSIELDPASLIKLHELTELDPAVLYAKAQTLGINYHAQYRRLKKLYAGRGCAMALLDMHSEEEFGSGEISPAGLDGALQLLFAAGMKSADFNLDKLYLPSQAAEFYLNKEAGFAAELYAFLEIVKAGRSSVVCDIKFIDTNGRQCGLLSGCRYRLVPQDEASTAYTYGEKLLPVSPLGGASLFDAAAFARAYRKACSSAALVEAEEHNEVEALFAAALCALTLKHIKCADEQAAQLPEQFFDLLIDEKAEPLADLLCRTLCRFNLASAVDGAYILKGSITALCSELDFDKLSTSLLCEYPHSAALVELLMLLDLKLETYLEEGRLQCFGPKLAYLLKRIELNSSTALLMQSILQQSINTLLKDSCYGRALRLLCVLADPAEYKYAEFEQKGCEIYRLLLSEDAAQKAAEVLDTASARRVFSSADLQKIKFGIDLPYFDALIVSAAAAAELCSGKSSHELMLQLSNCAKQGAAFIALSQNHSLPQELCSVLQEQQGGAVPVLAAPCSLDARFNAAGFDETVLSSGQGGLLVLRKHAADDTCQGTVDVFEHMAQSPDAGGRWLQLTAQGVECVTFAQLLLSDGAAGNSAEAKAVSASVPALTADERICCYLQPASDCRRLAQQLYQLSQLLLKQQAGSAPILMLLDGRVDCAAGCRAVLALLRTARHELKSGALRAVILKQGLPTAGNSAALEALLAELRLYSAADAESFKSIAPAYQEVVLDGAERMLVSLQFEGSSQHTAAKSSDVSDENSGMVPNRSLVFDRAGRLNSLHFEHTYLKAPKDDEVLIEVKASALNYRDVMWASGLLPDEALENGFVGETLGLECSGVVSAVGSKVTDLKPGDAVIAFAPASFADCILTRRSAVLLKPENMSFAKAAAMPVVFFTAYYALKCKAQARPGESILIHGGAGGVGLAALQLAKLMGLKVYASAGSGLKRRLLKALGADHVYDSRSYAFADEIRADAGKRGIDIVLNSLYEDGAALSLELLNPLGRFVELGKRDFYADHALHLKHFKDNLSYFAVDADALINLKPEFCAQLMQELMSLFESGSLKSIPLNLYTENEIQEAFSDLRAANGIGKLLVLKDSSLLQSVAETSAVPTEDESVHAGAPAELHKISAAGAAVISGGLGGLGSALCLHLAERGCSFLVIIGRRSSQEAAPALELLKSQITKVSAVCRVEYLSVDVSDKTALRQALEPLALSQISLCCHAAGFLNDQLMSELQAEDFEAQLKVKLQGARNLIAVLSSLTNTLPENFIFFSSVAALLGNPGQAAYAAANAALEGLCLELNLQGVNALCAGWGPVSGAGMLAQRTQVLSSLKRRLGTAALTVTEVLCALDAFAEQKMSGVHYCFKAGWQSVSADISGDERFLSICRHFNVQVSSTDEDLLNQLSKLNGKALEQALFELVCSETAALLGSSTAEIKAKTSLQDLGLDSLSLMELTAKLSDLLHLNLSPESFASCSSLQGFARSLAALMQGSSETELMLSAMQEQHGLKKEPVHD